MTRTKTNIAPGSPESTEGVATLPAPPTGQSELSSCSLAVNSDPLSATLRRLHHAAVEGDRSQFNQIFQEFYDLYRTKVDQVLSVLLMGRAKREQRLELSQKFFMHMSRMEVVEKYDPNKPASQWLGQILKNQFLDFARANKRYRTTSADFRVDLGQVELPDRKASPPGSQLEAEEVRETMCKVLSRLSLKQLKICRLMCDGLTDIQIAVELTIPRGTVKSALYSVRKKFEDLSDQRDNVRIIRQGGVNPIIKFLDAEIERRSPKSPERGEAAVA